MWSKFSASAGRVKQRERNRILERGTQKETIPAMTAIAISLLTFVSTSLGGLVALRQRRHLYLVMAFSAGVLVAAALFDLLPEAFNLVKEAPGLSIDDVLLATAIGYLLFYSLERFVHLSAAGHEKPEEADHEHDDPERDHHHDHHANAGFGTVAALGLSVHSFLDGFAIGVAFQASATIGAIVAVAVIAHDFSDGVSTVSVILSSRGGVRASIGWLLVDAIAPVVGAASALVLIVQPATLAPLLGFFAGTFLFIGGSHLLPESHHGRQSPLLPLLVFAGFAFLYVVTHVLATG